MHSKINNLSISSIWKDRNLLLWILPIAGYLTAISFDVGYLSYFNIPVSFAELNFHSVAVSSFILYLLLFSGTCFLLSVAELEEAEHWIFPTLFNAPLALGAITFGIFLYFAEDWPVINALWVYIIFNITRIYVIFTDKSSALPFSIKVRNFSFSDLKSAPSTSKSVLKARTNSLLDFWMLLLCLFVIAFMSGHSVAKIKFWRIEGHQNTIVISRNSNLFIEKEYDPITKILYPRCTLIFASEGKISLVPVEEGLKLQKTMEKKR
jgi:hypothetical protein